jgi:hypothetical protein
MSSEQAVLGIMELKSSSRVFTDGLKLLSCFAMFAAMSIERSRLMDLASLRKAELELKQRVSDGDRVQINAVL